MPFPLPGGSSQPRDGTCISWVFCIGRCVLYLLSYRTVHSHPPPRGFSNMPGTIRTVSAWTECLLETCWPVFTPGEIDGLDLAAQRRKLGSVHDRTRPTPKAKPELAQSLQTLHHTSHPIRKLAKAADQGSDCLRTGRRVFILSSPRETDIYSECSPPHPCFYLALGFSPHSTTPPPLSNC